MLEVILDGVALTCICLLVILTGFIGLGLHRIRVRLRELEALRASELGKQQRLVELSRANASRQFEVRWLMTVSEETATLDRLIEILDDSSQSVTGFYAWFLNHDGNILAKNSKAREHQFEITFTQAARNRLTGESIPVFSLSRAEFLCRSHLTELECPRLHVICCEAGASYSHPKYLCLTHIPSITGDPERDLALVSKLCRLLKTSSALSAYPANTQPDQEIDLIRDMLRLRTLTDESFQSPLVMLEEFLNQLVLLTDFERAGLYQTATGKSSDLERLASGGVPVSPQEHSYWNLLESQVVQSFHHSDLTFRWVNPAASTATNDKLKLQSCLIVSEDRPGRPTTTIILSSRSPVVQNQLKEDLAKWSAQFLPQTFEKALIHVQNEERARRDGLTQVANRQTFDTEFQKAIKNSLLNGTSCSLLLIDIDHFKSINDCYGHAAGDIVLQAVAETISHAVHQNRITDYPLVARYGGEEFSVVLPDVTLPGAERIADKIRAAIELQTLRHEDCVIRVTGSVGVASLSIHGHTANKILRAADKALYAAKDAGRNCVIVAQRHELTREDSSVASPHSRHGDFDLPGDAVEIVAIPMISERTRA